MDTYNQEREGKLVTEKYPLTTTDEGETLVEISEGICPNCSRNCIVQIGHTDLLLYSMLVEEILESMCRTSYSEKDIHILKFLTSKKSD
jgi:hypothetical protein